MLIHQLPPKIILSYKYRIVKCYAYKLQNINIIIFFEKIKKVINMQFPRMKEIREEAGLKQKDMAEIMHITKGSYSMWECGADTIPLRRLNEFCNYFNVSIDYVVGISNKKKYANTTPDIKLKITGENLKKIRNKKGLTQTEISNELNINQPTWNRYEKSRTLILTVVLIELAQKYHYSIDKILGKDKVKDNED